MFIVGILHPCYTQFWFASGDHSTRGAHHVRGVAVASFKRQQPGESQFSYVCIKVYASCHIIVVWIYILISRPFAGLDSAALIVPPALNLSMCFQLRMTYLPILLPESRVCCDLNSIRNAVCMMLVRCRIEASSCMSLTLTVATYGIHESLSICKGRHYTFDLIGSRVADVETSAQVISCTQR